MTGAESTRELETEEQDPRPAAALRARAASPSLRPEALKNKRHERVRARTVSVKRMSKKELERGRAATDDVTLMRPHTRDECMQGANATRPCPFVSCKHHLFLDVSDRTGSIKLNFPDLEVWELAESCALDIADRGGVTLEDVGQIMNLTRERIRQLETRGVERLKTLSEMAALRDYCG